MTPPLSCLTCPHALAGEPHRPCSRVSVACKRAYNRWKWRRHYAKHRAEYQEKYRNRWRTLHGYHEPQEDAALIEWRFRRAKAIVRRTFTIGSPWAYPGHPLAGFPESPE